jgi:hypothetical protein
MSKLYQVEKILDKQVKNGKLRYLIKWVGWSDEDSTWEPLENLSSILHMITDFEVGQSKRDTESNGLEDDNNSITTTSKR